MKRALTFKLLVDPRDVRRAIALVLGESITDEEMDEQFFDRTDLPTIEPPQGQEFEITAGLVALMVAADLESPADKESAFAKKMRLLQEGLDKKKV